MLQIPLLNKEDIHPATHSQQCTVSEYNQVIQKLL